MSWIDGNNSDALQCMSVLGRADDRVKYISIHNNTLQQLGNVLMMVNDYIWLMVT